MTEVVPAVAEGSAGAAGIAGKVETVPYVAPPLPRILSVSIGPSDTPLLRYVLYAYSVWLDWIVAPELKYAAAPPPRNGPVVFSTPTLHPVTREPELSSMASVA